MKNLLLIFSILTTLSFTNTVSASHTEPAADKSTVIVNSEVSVSVDKDELAEAFVNISYKNSNISLETKSEIAFLQVVNLDGEVEYQLPIGSNKLNLSSEDFESGVYTVNLLFNNSDEFVSTTLEKF